MLLILESRKLEVTKQKITGDELVVTDNGFMQAAYNLDIVELRLIALAIIVLRKNSDTPSVEFSAIEPINIHASLYAELFGTTKQNAYMVLDAACKSLEKRKISWNDSYADEKTNKKYKRLNNLAWTTLCSYVPDIAMIQITFSPQIIPLLIYLDDNFRGYEIRNLANLKTIYEFHLYEFATRWRDTGKGTFKKETLRQRMGIIDPQQFSRSSNFTRLLSKSTTQINTKTDLTLGFEPIYERVAGVRGQTITKYTMTVRVKTEAERVELGLHVQRSMKKYKSAGYQPDLLGAKESKDDKKPQTKPQDEKNMRTVNPEDEDEFLKHLGSNGKSTLKYDSPEDVVFTEPETIDDMGSEFNVISQDYIRAYPNENGEWDHEFILKYLSKPKFQIVGMDIENIPIDLLKGTEEYLKYCSKVNETVALMMAKNSVSRKITLRIDSVKARKTIAENHVKVNCSHKITYLTDLQKKEVLSNGDFVARYAPRGQSNPAYVKTYLEKLLDNDLSKIPDLEDYLRMSPNMAKYVGQK